jgi:hypothetical protein
MSRQRSYASHGRLRWNQSTVQRTTDTKRVEECFIGILRQFSGWARKLSRKLYPSLPAGRRLAPRIIQKAQQIRTYPMDFSLSSDGAILLNVLNQRLFNSRAKRRCVCETTTGLQQTQLIRRCCGANHLDHMELLRSFAQQTNFM